MHTQKHIIANWKMYMSFHQMITWCETHYNALHEISKYIYLGITPEATAIAAIQNTLKDIPDIMIGGQTCSSHKLGAHTGDISAQSLADLGCNICLVGHSEQRVNYHITSNDVVQRVHMLLQQQITPIICIGETEQDRINKNTTSVIKQQLQPIISHLNYYSPTHIYIAYEPRWAIGSGNTPSDDDIAQVANDITSYTQKHTNIPPYILYGGSVSPENSKNLAHINEIDGFLIGSASCDFKELKKIVINTI